jgi:hypothetical protein
LVLPAETHPEADLSTSTDHHVDDLIEDCPSMKLAVGLLPSQAHPMVLIEDYPSMKLAVGLLPPQAHPMVENACHPLNEDCCSTVEDSLNFFVTFGMSQ